MHFWRSLPGNAERGARKLKAREEGFSWRALKNGSCWLPGKNIGAAEVVLVPFLCPSFTLPLVAISYNMGVNCHPFLRFASSLICPALVI